MVERAEIEKMDSKALLRMHDDIHKIMEARSLDMKKRHREMVAASKAK